MISRHKKEGGVCRHPLALVESLVRSSTGRHLPRCAGWRQSGKIAVIPIAAKRKRKPAPKCAQVGGKRKGHSLAAAAHRVRRVVCKSVRRCGVAAHRSASKCRLRRTPAAACAHYHAARSVSNSALAFCRVAQQDAPFAPSSGPSAWQRPGFPQFSQ